MSNTRSGNQRQLTALTIIPDRELARQFAESLPVTGGFQILAELKAYPPPQTLEIGLRQLQPEVVLLDLATDLPQALALIDSIAVRNPSIRVIGLHAHNDPGAIVASLRQGASEFLCAPFDPAIQEQALKRIRRLIDPPAHAAEAVGTVILFSSAKPGSGASTLAAQLSFALHSGPAKRVLLADLDRMTGTVSFYLKIDAGAAEDVGPGGVVSTRQGIDVFPTGAAPGDSLELPRLRELLERSRATYDWILLDLPAIFHRATLEALPEADQTFLVTTAELPSLHLTRKALLFLGQLGFGRERIQVLVNRVVKRRGLGMSDVEKILGTAVHSSFPNDYFSLDRALAQGEPLGSGCELGRAIEELARGLAASAPLGGHGPAPEARAEACSRIGV
jgi:pilus assembly protein CpaE